MFRSIFYPRLSTRFSKKTPALREITVSFYPLPTVPLVSKFDVEALLAKNRLTI